MAEEYDKESNDMNSSEDMFDQFVKDRGLEDEQTWIDDYNKKKCPDCFALHDQEAESCSVCGWEQPK
jgi:hypothetical protein